MVRTSGSSAAWAMNRSADEVKLSYGWWTSMSPARITANTSAGSSSSGGRSRAGVTGVHGASLRSGRSVATSCEEGRQVEHPLIS